MHKGQSILNGIDGIGSSQFNYGERLTIVRRDNQSYGVERFVVKDRHGRHGYAY